MLWNIDNLNKKFITGTAAGLVISSLVFLLLFVTMYRTELEQQRIVAALQVNNLLKSSLENAMLKRDLDGLRVIVDQLGKQENILGVMISNPAGVVRFSSNPADIGRHLPKSLINSTAPSSHFINNKAGTDILRSINPVHNKPQCKECHGPAETKPINGILLVDFSAAAIRNKAKQTTLLLMGSGALIVIINLTGGWWFIRKYVLIPLKQLSSASQALSKGELETRVKLNGKDELSKLGETFNMMADKLQQKINELEEGKLFLQELIDADPDGIRIIDQNYNILLSNKTYRQQCGLAEKPITSNKCYAAIHDRDAPCPTTLISCPLHEIQKEEKPVKVIHRHTRTDGSTMDVEIYAAPMHVLRNGKPETLVIESIRDLAQEIRYSHEHRLSELGHIAAGVSHEIHNPLTSIRMALHASMSELELTPINTDQVHNYYNLIDKEIDKCIEVTERLLKLSTHPPSEPELISVPVVISETLSLLKWEAHELGININTNLSSKNLRVYATDSEMRMVTLNLAQNAFHAMPKGGELTVTAYRENGTIRINFDDTGIGIKPEHIVKIFDPFFSRRGDGINGTGLGLSISRAIIENYGGSIRATSSSDKGSRFTISLADADVIREVTE